MLKIGFLVDRRYVRQEITTAITHALGAYGATVDMICPQECQFEPGRGRLINQNGAIYELDTYHLLIPRTRSALGLALLSYARTARIPVINGYEGIRKARNKIEVAVTLAQTGIRSAPTILAEDAATLSRLPATWYPLILKAVYGDNSQGLRLIRKPEELDLVSWSDELVLAQHYLPNNGFDLKLYASGISVFASRKPSPFNNAPDAQLQPIAPNAEMIHLVLQVGQVLGLEIYGVDAIETPDGPVVIEVNDFPNFTGIRGAADQIANYIMGQVRQPAVSRRPVMLQDRAFPVFAAAGV